MDEANNTVSELSEHITLPRAWYMFNGSILSTIAFVASIENIVVLLIFFKHKNLRIPPNVFIISVAVGDVIMACVIPLSASSNFSGKWIHGDVWCTTEAFIVYIVGMADIYCITATAIQRYLIVTKVDNSSYVRMKATVITLILSWFAALFWAVGPLAGWSAYGTEGAGVSCGLAWARNDIGSQVYIIVLFVLGFVFPSGSIMFCYGSIYRKVVRSSANLRASKQRSYNRRNARIVKTAFILTCGFFIAWTPYAIVSFWAAFGDANNIPIWLVSSPAMFAKCSCVWNPIIYAGTNKQFRDGFVDIIPCGGLRKALKEEQSSVVNGNTSNTTVFLHRMIRNSSRGVNSRTPTEEKSLFPILTDDKASSSYFLQPPSNVKEGPIRKKTDDQEGQTSDARTIGDGETITSHIQTDDSVKDLTLPGPCLGEGKNKNI